LTDGLSPEDRRELNQVAVATGLGCSIVASIVLTIGGGVLLDRAFDTAPVLTLIGVALGLIVAGYQIYELALMGQRGRRPPPIARGLAKLPVGRKRVE
jgi:F0F1-type ATP synthase assembly protein I